MHNRREKFKGRVNNSACELATRSPSMTEFIHCPFCAGHESISAEAADRIKEAIERLLAADETLSQAQTELMNIRNAILNAQERAAQPILPKYIPPLCPTPGKRPYVNREHALPFAVKWNQYEYECACGYWHLSKQSQSEHTAKINSPAASADEFEAIDPLLL